MFADAGSPMAVYGLRTNALFPVKSADGRCLLTDLSDITDRWREHFYKLLKGN